MEERKRQAMGEKEMPKKRRTRRGIALKSPRKSVDNEDIGIPIYSSQIERFRADKKKITTKSDLQYKVINPNPDDDYDSESEVLPTLPMRVGDKEELDEIQAPLSPPMFCPTEIRAVPQKKKCKQLIEKLDFAANRFQMQMREEETEIKQSSLLDESDCVFIDTNREFLLKLRWRSKIKKISVKGNQSFHQIIAILAEMVAQPAGKLILTFNDYLIKPTDTPVKLGISVSDIIECGLLSNESVRKNPGKNSGKDPNLIKLKLQTKEMKKKVEIEMLKTDPMSTLIEKFAQQQNLSSKKIILQFDGEDLDETSTPDELEIENDYCIDVIIRS